MGQRRVTTVTETGNVFGHFCFSEKAHLEKDELLKVWKSHLRECAVSLDQVTIGTYLYRKPRT